MLKLNVSSKKLLQSIGVLLLGIIYMMPVFLIFMNAFKPNKDILLNFIAFPKSFYLDNFKQAMAEMNFWITFKNTVIVTLGTVLLTIFTSFLGAFGISHLKGKLSTSFYLFFILGQIISFYSIMIAVSIMAKNLHMTNSLLGLILLYSGFYSGFAVMTYVGFLKSVPKELEEAATLDGCGLWQMMTKVSFPLVIPTTVTLSVLFFLWTWNDFLMPSILIGEKELRTITVNLFMFKMIANTSWNLFIAGLTLSITPVIIIYIAAQKYITSGLISGAIK